MSTSRSPGSPIARSSTFPSGYVRRRTTFFSVSAAVQARSLRRRSARSFDRATSVSMVGVSGVSSTWAAGTSVWSSAAGAGVTTASTFAA